MMNTSGHMPSREAADVNERESGEELSVRELVDAAGLGLQLLAGARGIDLRLEAVYIGDLEDPTPWMVPGSLLLTTGPTFESDPEAAPKLVRILKRSGAVGVGVAITPHVNEIPQSMVAEAEAVGLPLVRVPPETPFRAIASYVFNALTSRDMHRLRRSLALQNQLLQVLLEERGVEGLVQRLAGFIAGDTMLFDSHGNLLARSAGGASGGDLGLAAASWAEYREITTQATPRSLLDVGDCRVHYREAVVEGAVERVLMSLQPKTSVVSEHEEAALTFAQRLIEVDLNTTRNLAGMRRRTRAGLLDMLVRGRGTAAELSERLLYHGIPPSRPWRILVVAAEPVSRSASAPRGGVALADVLLENVERVLEERGTAFLSLVSSGQVVVLHPREEDKRINAESGGERAPLIELVERVESLLRGRRVRIGASEPLSELDAAPAGLAHARQCLETMLGSPRACGDVMLYEDLGLHAQLLDCLPSDVLVRFRSKVVARLEAVDRREGSDLVNTLARYLAHDCSVAATSEELYVHRNTLRKRLARIEQIVDLDLSRVDALVEAFLGLRATEVLEIRTECEQRPSGTA